MASEVPRLSGQGKRDVLCGRIALDWAKKKACWQLYTPGPGETLDNFMVHVRNRQHRANVEGRSAAGLGTS
jgi:hypothetical protein